MKMGRAIKCFRAIFGLSNQRHNQKAKKWIFGKKSKQNAGFHHKQSTEKNCNEEDGEEEEDNMRKSVGANVSRGRAAYGEDANMGRRREDHGAAIVVQSHFRGYLARRALRALRGLVKLQALARGHLARKQTADALRRLQALMRARDKVRSGRVNMTSESPRSGRKSSPFTYVGPTTPKNSETAVRARNKSKNERAFEVRSSIPHKNRTPLYDNRSSQRTCKLRSITAYGEAIHKHAHSSHLSLSSDQCCQSFSTSKDSVLSPSSAEVQSFSRNLNVEEAAFHRATVNSPRFCSSSSVGGNSSSHRRERRDTPTRSDGTVSCLSNSSDHPNYMAYTESSRAKVRSLSVSKHRQTQFEASSSANRYSRSNMKRSSNSHVNFGNKGRLDMLGMPVRSDTISL